MLLITLVELELLHHILILSRSSKPGQCHGKHFQDHLLLLFKHQQRITLFNVFVGLSDAAQLEEAGCSELVRHTVGGAGSQAAGEPFGG